MNIQCPNCKSLITTSAHEFPALNELYCNACEEEIILKRGPVRVISLQFILTESLPSGEENAPENLVEISHQNVW